MQIITEGLRVGEYHIVEKIGEGSVGEVWRAIAGEKSVAIKFLNLTLLEREDREIHLRRFKIEAYVLSQLVDLAHIPHLIQTKIEVKRPYFIMDYINTPSFAELINTGEMMLIPLLTRLEALQKVATTLYSLHDRSILHRDIKPGNLHGIHHPYLLDFSIALPVKHANTADSRVGTALYMPPEDTPPFVGTDSYGFALVIYEMLFGQHPIFDLTRLSSTSEALREEAKRAIVSGLWHKPSQLSSDQLPVNLRGANLSQLDKIFQQALGNPQTRYTDVRQLLRDIRAAIETPQNADYIEELPAPNELMGAMNTADIEHLTEQLIVIDELHTDLPPNQTVTERWTTQQLIFGLTAVYGLVMIVVVFVVLSNR